jgi:hypothetical protein
MSAGFGGGSGGLLGGGWCSKIKVRICGPLVVAATQRGLGGWLALTSTLTILHHAHLPQHSESFSKEMQQYSCELEFSLEKSLYFRSDES